MNQKFYLLFQSERTKFLVLRNRIWLKKTRNFVFGFSWRKQKFWFVRIDFGSWEPKIQLLFNWNSPQLKQKTEFMVLENWFWFIKARNFVFCFGWRKNRISASYLERFSRHETIDNCDFAIFLNYICKTNILCVELIMKFTLYNNLKIYVKIFYKIFYYIDAPSSLKVTLKFSH